MRRAQSKAFSMLFNTFIFEASVETSTDSELSLNLDIRACQEEFRMRRQLSLHSKPISAKYFVVCQKGFGSQKARQRSSMCSKQKRLHSNFAS